MERNRYDVFAPDPYDGLFRVPDSGGSPSRLTAVESIMAIYTMWIIAAKRDPSGRWRGDPKRKIQCVGVGVAGMMITASSILTKIRGSRAARSLEGTGVVLTKDELSEFLLRQPGDQRLRRQWLDALSSRRRYAIVARET